uniref:At3g05675-like ankyrin-like domain-containing protein n=2 Tax=Salix viminalis TaxID=40686 RepID=A0A6N2KIE6_SALVM
MLARDNKARREMKTRIYGFFREDSLDHKTKNMSWIAGIPIDRKIGDEFVKLWADQEQGLSHSRVPTVYRHEISKITMDCNRKRTCLGAKR